MNKDILNQYTSLKREISDEQRRIDRLEDAIKSMVPKSQQAADKVSLGKRGKKSLGSVTIRGIGDQTTINRKRAILRNRKAKQELRLAKMEMLVCDMEDYINRINDSEVRRIMKFFYLDGMTWAQTAVAMGDGYTPEACKKKMQRGLKK